MTVAGLVAGAARAQEGSLVWPFTLQGFITSSPATNADGSVIFVGVESRNGRGRVFAVPRDGRSLVWTTAELSNGISAVPVVTADSLYVAANDGRFYALNISNGAIRWEKSLSALTSAALSSDGVLYFGGIDNKLHAIEAATGNERWTFPTDDVIESAPAIGPDGTIYFGSDDHFIYAVRPDGTQRWRVQTGGLVSSSPAIGRDGSVYVGSSDQRMYAIAPNGAKKWDHFTNGDIQSSPALAADGKVCFASVDGFFYALRPEDGSEAWKTEFRSTTKSTAAIRGDGVIIFGADDGRVRALNADGSLRWTYDTPSHDLIEASPIVAPDGAIYIGSLDGVLYKLAGTNSPLSSYSSWPAFHRDIERTGRASPAAAGRLFNLSTRAQVPAGDTLVVGFFVQGAGQKAFLIRGIGPALAQFGISGFMTDPRLDVYAAQQLLLSNDNWGDRAFEFDLFETNARVGAFPLPQGSKDAVALDPLAPGLYTARVTNNDNAAGVALVEVYDAIGGDPTGRLLNVSTLGPVGALRENFLVAGISVGGTGPTRLLVRGVGPSLAQFGVSGVLAQPTMSIYTAASATVPSRLLRTNSGWTTEGFTADLVGAGAAVAAFSLAANSADAAVILTVEPGNYTVEISGANGTTGRALVEVYVLP